MNKFAVVLGVAAVVAIAGCKDPDYVRHSRGSSQNEVKPLPPAEEPTPAPEVTPVVEPTPEPVPPPKCLCAPGTKHTEPCACGGENCTCVVETSAPAPEPEYTTYIVQRGDYLAKISKKYNVRVDAIKKLNGMKNDTIRLGQKIKLPGKIDVGEQKVPTVAPVQKTTTKKPKVAYKPYEGPTTEYVVKSGDSLSKIAAANGMNTRQLKELNGLSKDFLKVGQKLKVAAKVDPATNGGVEVAGSTKTDPAVVPQDSSKKVVPPVTGNETPDPQSDADTLNAPVTPAVVTNPAQPVAVPVVQPGEKSFTDYKVMEGDTVVSVSLDTGVSPTTIRELNGMGDNEDTLKPGSIIKLPAEP